MSELILNGVELLDANYGSAAFLGSASTPPSENVCPPRNVCDVKLKPFPCLALFQNLNNEMAQGGAKAQTLPKRESYASILRGYPHVKFNDPKIIHIHRASFSNSKACSILSNGFVPE